MGERTIIPFGPQHPALPEPIHLDLVLEDEHVVEAIPSIGFIHRGLEKLVEKKDFQDYVYVAERICGICSFMHGMGYCMAVERVMGLEVPRRALLLRTLWAELSRMHNHSMWLGLLADAIGFESLFMHCWRVREQVLDIFDMTTGGRVIFSVCKVGGVRRDIDSDGLKTVSEKIEKIVDEARAVTEVMLRDGSSVHRLKGLGYLSAADAHDLGAVGPMARASGLQTDMRKLGYAAYDEIKFDVAVEEGGDCLARTAVRASEFYESAKIIQQCITLLLQMEPGSPIDVPVKGNPDGEYFVRLEQPRGEVFYYVRGNGTKFLDRMRVRTPTFANIPSLVHMLKGVELADVPVLVVTIDPCISCTER